MNKHTGKVAGPFGTFVADCQYNISKTVAGIDLKHHQLIRYQ